MVAVTRTEHVLEPDPRRVVARPFVPGEANFGGSADRVNRIVERVRQLSDSEVAAELESTHRRSADRHRDIESVWQANADLAITLTETGDSLDADRRRFVGMAFTQEYTFESTALCNPSMVAIAEESREGDLEFVMSARSIGEGHLSSISFRGGVVSSTGSVSLDPTSEWAGNGTRSSRQMDRAIFRDRLGELGADNDVSARVLADLDPQFSLTDLVAALAHLAESDVTPAMRFETERAMHWLASSNYDLTFGDVPLSERLISPAGPTESRGMEDARFVRFRDDDGSVRFYATYTAFDGFEVLPQLIETTDFVKFRIATLAGACARSKGMALFPRRIAGEYAALARTDNESTFVMTSSHVRRWDVAELALRPTEAWEIIQAGNCGSPIETDDGWLVLMHGVGTMRRYVLSAVLLDLDEPTKVLARLREPLLEPQEDERNGYVPNVVYSCGGMLHGDFLVIPYGFSDTGIRLATVSLESLLAGMD